MRPLRCWNIQGRLWNIRIHLPKVRLLWRYWNRPRVVRYGIFWILCRLRGGILLRSFYINFVFKVPALSARSRASRLRYAPVQLRGLLSRLPYRILLRGVGQREVSRMRALRSGSRTRRLRWNLPGRMRPLRRRILQGRHRPLDHHVSVMWRMQCNFHPHRLRWRICRCLCHVSAWKEVCGWRVYRLRRVCGRYEPSRL